jgi:hypothetical protein
MAFPGLSLVPPAGDKAPWRRSCRLRRLRIGQGSFIFVKCYPLEKAASLLYFQLHNIFLILSNNLLAVYLLLWLASFGVDGVVGILFSVHFSSTFIFYSMLLPKSILSQRLGADSDRRECPCGTPSLRSLPLRRDEGTAKRSVAKTHFATRPVSSFGAYIQR